MKLTEVFRGILLEATSIEDIGRAIDQKQVVVIYYDGDEPGGKGVRTIEPVCFFRHKDSGNWVLSAWDREGASHKVAVGDGFLPFWRLFRLDKIRTLKPTRETFSQPRPNFNPNGDKRAMPGTIKYLAKF